MIILELCFSDGCGGLEHYVRRSVKWLKGHGHSVHALVANDTILAQWLEEDDIQHQCMITPSRTLPLQSAQRVAGTIEQHQVQVVHIHSSRDLNLAVLAKFLSTLSVTLVYSIHLRPRNSKRDPVHRWIYNNLDLIIANSRCVHEDTKLNLPVSDVRCELLYPGVGKVHPIDCLKLLDRHGVGSGRFTAALFGRIEHAKGQHVLIGAIKKLLEEGVNVHALIAGPIMDKKYHEDLQREISASGLSANVSTTGFLDNSMAAMQCFDAVVLPTYNEAFGLVLIEAMNAGAAVIGANVGGVPEIIDNGHNGLLFDPGDAQGLAHHIKSLAQNPPLKEKLIEGGKQTVLKNFSEDEHYRRLTRLFKDTGWSDPLEV